MPIDLRHVCESPALMKHVEVEGSLDYVATGLPRAGDVIDGERYVDDASPWGFSLVFVLPMAPLIP